MVLARYHCSAETLIDAVRKFPRKRVLVIGDVMLDRFIWGSVSRISPEAPVPVVEIRTETTCLGGAANVAANIKSLGATAIPLGVIGRDDEGRKLREILEKMGSPTSGLVVDAGRATTVKTRIIAHHQQVCRTDREERSPLAPAIHRKVIERFRIQLPKVDAVVISDYAKGLITASFLKEILPAAKSAGRIVCVDPKQRNLAAYQPSTIITPNTLEAERASGIAISGKSQLQRAGRRILQDTRIQHLLITRGEEGMALFEGKERITYIPTVAREVYDVTGAGDTVISTLALGLAAGLSTLEAAMLSNFAAGIVVGKLGTASATPEELIYRIQHQ
jgi:rfaE bifunctional protein kinase chain/domain